MYGQLKSNASSKRIGIRLCELPINDEKKEKKHLRIQLDSYAFAFYLLIQKHFVEYAKSVYFCRRLIEISKCVLFKSIFSALESVFFPCLQIFLCIFGLVTPFCLCVCVCCIGLILSVFLCCFLLSLFSTPLFR